MEEISEPKIKRKETGRYVFPNILAKMMAGVSQRVQYEAGLLSITFILIGLIVMGVYVIFFTELPIFAKIMTGINMGAGFVFLSSHLVMTFQQYQNYLKTMGIIEEWNTQ